jgi:type I restriction-modification system DNA methylase subunit
LDRKTALDAALRAFGSQPLGAAARNLFGALGYRSERRLVLAPNTPAQFLSAFAQGKSFDGERALLGDWRAVDFLFQLTDAEVQAATSAQSTLPFDSSGRFDGAIIQSYLFFAVDLAPPAERAGDRAGRPYSRTELAQITRAVNRLFGMPAFLLFRHGEALTLAVIRRRLHKREESRDVLERVTLVKDIRFADPLRAHVEILHDLSLPALQAEFSFHNFVGLHQAWEKRLDTYALNERFYRDVANWYFWALGHEGVVLPRTIEGLQDAKERDKQRSLFFIRLLTRLIFCWFLQEKGLIPRDVFRRRFAEQALRDFGPASGTYYRAFLQNLFFATLNQEAGRRGWRKKKDYSGSRDGNWGVTNLCRYADLLIDPAAFLALLQKGIPFVNGGLFECLDDVYREPRVRLDDFSEHKDNRLCLPNELFFGEERELDLSQVYEDKRRRKEKVRGLLEILSRYKFTVEENTPLEEEIALDPELLGKVFENLLASYNEDTRTTARKAHGAFYTPRPIVGYLVDESLVETLASRMAAAFPQGSEGEGWEPRLRQLVTAPADRYQSPFSPEETDALIAAIDALKILDPACGSGAFPMGALHRLVDILQKLDPNNARWKEQQLRKAEEYREVLERSGASKGQLADVDAHIEDIRHSFDTRFHALDFARKLYLIENCIYGVDILPIACQIAKLRFFIALIADQHVDPQAPNLGVRPLPNLETKIVAADTLVPIERRSVQGDFFQEDNAAVREVAKLRQALEAVRHEYFAARTPEKKRRCRERDAELRKQIADHLKKSGMPAQSSSALASWNPYDQNHAATFFDPEWMFGLKIEAPGARPRPGAADEDGFDIVLGNPPYVRIQTLKQQNPKLAEFFKGKYESARKGNYDLYVVFVERGLQLLKKTGTLAYILPHKFFNAQYGEPLRGLIAKGKHLKHVVHFGDQQVFPGASNYVCLLILGKTGAEALKYVRADDLALWLQTYRGTEGYFPVQTVSSEEWHFNVGQGAQVFDRLKATGKRLEEVTARIFQGVKTSADKIYIVEEVSRSKARVVVSSPQTGKHHELEADLLHPLVKGGDSKSFCLSRTNRLILFPYSDGRDGTPALVPASTLRKRFPLTWAYLEENREYLEGREDGSFRGEAWYAFGRSQALDVIGLPKLFTPDLAPQAAFSYDSEGGVFFTGGVAGGYGILSKPNVEPRFLLALLNSRAVDFLHHRIATQMRGGWYSYEARFIRDLPIASGTAPQEAAVVRLVDHLLWLHRHLGAKPAERSARDELALGYLEQLLNALVYELYFPDDLHAQNLRFFDLVEQAHLPDLADIPEGARLERLRQVFETLYDGNHPIRIALAKLQTLDLVRIIEGKAGAPSAPAIPEEEHPP